MSTSRGFAIELAPNTCRRRPCKLRNGKVRAQTPLKARALVATRDIGPCRPKSNRIRPDLRANSTGAGPVWANIGLRSDELHCPRSGALTELRRRPSHPPCMRPMGAPCQHRRRDAEDVRPDVVDHELLDPLEDQLGLAPPLRSKARTRASCIARGRAIAKRLDHFSRRRGSEATGS